MVSDPDGDQLSFTISGENESQVNCTAGGQSNITMKPALNWNGIADCTVRVNDSYNYTDKNFFITVNPINDAPKISGLPNITATEDVNYTLNVTSYINDVDNSTEQLNITEDSIYAIA